MRPPILFLTIGFGVGLWAGLDPVAFPGAAVWGVAVPVVVVAAVLAQPAPLGAAVGIMGVAGLLWGGAAVRERGVTCAGRWSREQGAGSSKAAIVRLLDPAPDSGGAVDADVVGGACGGALRLKWPEGYGAAGGTTWVVAGRWTGFGERGVLVVRRAHQLDPVPRGRGAWRDRLAARLVLILQRLRLPPRRRVVAAALLLLGYLWLLGFPAPALRAAVMLVVHDIARLRQRVVAPSGSVALAALVVLVADPWAMRSVGAWLSVASIGAVIWAGRAAQRLPLAARLAAPALAATLVTAPITAFAFGTVAPIGVLANLVAIPLAGIVVPGLAMALGLSWLMLGLARLVAGGAGAGLALLDLTAQVAARVPGGHVVMAAGWQAAALWAAVALAAWWLWNSPRRPWHFAARIAFVSAILLWTSVLDVVPLDACRCLTVHFLDVGQGDAAALRTPQGRWIVIDGGPRTPESDAGRRVVIPFLRRQGAGRLALVVATHGDADHLGGLPAVVDAFDPELVLEPGEPLGRPLYLEFLAAVEASDARWHAARAGDRIELDGVVLEVLSPDSLWLALPLDVNEHGVVLRVTFGAVRLLFQADAGLSVEGRLAGRVGPVEVLKVGHHGSRSATSEAWLAEL